VPERSFGLLLDRFRHLKRTLLPWTPEHVLAHKTGRVSDKFKRAYESLRAVPFEARDNNVYAFVKVEKNNVEKVLVKHPRLIQYRSPRFTASFAQYLLPVEQALMRPKDLTKSFFAKMMNQRSRAHRFIEMQKRVPDCVFIGWDHDNFDAHEHKSWIRAEHKFYAELMIEPREFLERAKTQLRYKGRTRGGIRYRSDGRRCSGDYNTGLGNSVVNLSIILDILKRARVPTKNWDTCVDGDDGVLGVSRQYVRRLLSRYLTPASFALYGMSTRLEFVTENLHEVEFCQSRLVDFGCDKRMIRLPLRVLSRAGYCLRNYQATGIGKWLRSVGDCELACNAGVPVLQSYALMLQRFSKTTIGLRQPEVVAAMRGAVHGPIELPIRSETRVSFAEAFGIGPSEQRDLESRFNSYTDLTYVGKARAGEWTEVDIEQFIYSVLS
jgi:hypothetical protein